ncbi:MAG: c-type cytochrome [Candidatus Eisenbacteria bacterium]
MSKGTPAEIERGKFLVTIGGCNDCHTPWKMGPKGPEPDMTRYLSGHPAEMQMPPPPAAAGPWIIAGGATMTAWASPAGIAYSANLTSDAETGLGAWDEALFIRAMRSGKSRGAGRPILPPMPWPTLAQLNDADLKAMFAYLQTVPAVKNEVPQSMPAPMPGAAK